MNGVDDIGLKQKRIGVLMGGLSSERDVSLRSGAVVCRTLVESGYSAVSIDVDNDISTRIAEERIEIAFIALHGRFGEDGCIQGLLELAGIPYTGSPVLASAIAMNKSLTKQLLRYHSLPTPDFKVITRGYDIASLDAEGVRVVKPVSQGSTIGVSVVTERPELEGAIEEALLFDDTVIIEHFIEGKEYTVGILNGKVLPVVEIKTAPMIYDHNTKYGDSGVKYVVPAMIDTATEKTMRNISLAAYQLVGCKGAARVDIIIDSTNNPYILEINTVPGLTGSSLLPMAARAAGISFDRLIVLMLEEALSLYNKGRKIKNKAIKTNWKTGDSKKN